MYFAGMLLTRGNGLAADSHTEAMTTTMTTMMVTTVVDLSSQLEVEMIIKN